MSHKARAMLNDALRGGAGPLLLAGALSALCQRAAGASLGLFLGGLGVVTLIGPALTLAGPTIRRRAWAFAGLIAGVGTVWAWGGSAQVTSVEWLTCLAVLAAYAAALVAMAAALERLKVHAVLAAALSVVLGCAWLTWPIWMAPWLTGERRERIVAALVVANPLFAVNGSLLRPFPRPWAQQRLAYQWTNIGDDIPYTLPGAAHRGAEGQVEYRPWRAALPAVTLHGLIALGCLAPALLSRWRRAAGLPGSPGHPPAGQ